MGGLCRPRPRAITPPSLVDVLRRSWKGAVPLLHPSTLKKKKSPPY
jgi:hypothetical protein